jgi:hypothetical protein
VSIFFREPLRQMYSFPSSFPPMPSASPCGPCNGGACRAPAPAAASPWAAYTTMGASPTFIAAPSPYSAFPTPVTLPSFGSSLYSGFSPAPSFPAPSFSFSSPLPTYATTFPPTFAPLNSYSSFPSGAFNSPFSGGCPGGVCGAPATFTSFSGGCPGGGCGAPSMGSFSVASGFSYAATNDFPSGSLSIPSSFPFAATSGAQSVVASLSVPPVSFANLPPDAAVSTYLQPTFSSAPVMSDWTTTGATFQAPPADVPTSFPTTGFESAEAEHAARVEEATRRLQAAAAQGPEAVTRAAATLQGLGNIGPLSIPTGQIQKSYSVPTEETQKKVLYEEAVRQRERAERAEAALAALQGSHQ